MSLPPLPDRARVDARPGDVIQVAIDPDAVHLFDADSGVRLST